MSDNIEWQADRQQRAFDWFAVADVDATQALADAHGDATWKADDAQLKLVLRQVRSEGNPGLAEVPKRSLNDSSGEPRWSRMFVQKAEPSRSGDF